MSGSVPYNPEQSVVKITFANDKSLIAGVINNPDTALGNNTKIASTRGLLTAKILAIDRRSEEGDFKDVAALKEASVCKKDLSRPPEFKKIANYLVWN